MFNFKYKNADGLWVKIITLTHQDASKAQIVLLPMIHVADKLYYEEMCYEQWCCDTVILEGVTHPIGRMLNKFYRAFAALKNIGAAAQSAQSISNDEDAKKRREGTFLWHAPQEGAPLEHTCYLDYPDVDPGKMRRAVRFVKGDVSASTARESLKMLPWWVYAVAPFAMIGALITVRFQSRSQIIDALFPEGAVASYDGGGSADRALNTLMKFAGDTRDKHLAEVLLHEINSPANKGKTIGIKFGVGHMHPLIKMLRKAQSYKIANKRGVLAWAIDPKAQVASPNDCYGIAKEKYYDIMIEPSRKQEALRNPWAADWPSQPASARTANISFSLPNTPISALTPAGRTSTG